MPRFTYLPDGTVVCSECGHPAGSPQDRCFDAWLHQQYAHLRRKLESAGVDVDAIIGDRGKEAPVAPAPGPAYGEAATFVPFERTDGRALSQEAVRANRSGALLAAIRCYMRDPHDRRPMPTSWLRDRANQLLYGRPKVGQDRMDSAQALHVLQWLAEEGDVERVSERELEYLGWCDGRAAYWRLGPAGPDQRHLPPPDL